MTLNTFLYFQSKVIKARGSWWLTGRAFSKYVQGTGTNPQYHKQINKQIKANKTKMISPLCSSSDKTDKAS